MTIKDAIAVQKWIQDNLFAYDNVNKSTNMAIKAFETIQRIDDVLDTEGMTEIDILDEILDAMSEYRYDCREDV